MHQRHLPVVLAAGLLAGCVCPPALAPAPPEHAQRPRQGLPSDDPEPGGPPVVIAQDPPPPAVPVGLPPVDLTAVPRVLPPLRGRAASPHLCGGKFTARPLVAPPARLLDSAAGVGIDPRGGRLLRFEPAQIDLFDGTAWRRIADTQSVPPGGRGPFTQLHGGWIDDATVLFRGSFDGQFGLFRWRGGQLERLVDRTTATGGGTLTEIGLPTLAGGTVWFWAEAGGQRATANLYGWRDGVLAVPPALTAAGVLAMGTPIARDGLLLFSGGSATQQGIYAFDGTRLQLLVPPTARTPDGAPLGPLILAEPSRLGAGVLFVADGGGQGRRGLWYAEAQAVHAVIDPATTVVDTGAFPMVAAVGPFVDADVVLFQAHRALGTGERRYGLYALRNCMLFTLAESGDVLDDRKVKHVAHMYPQAVADGLVIFPVVFEDGAQATYAARLR